MSSVILGVLAGVAVGKLVMRRRRHWMMRRGGGPGGWGGFGGWRGHHGEGREGGEAAAVGGEGAAPDEGRGFRFRWFQRRARAWGGGESPPRVDLAGVLKGLELNERQRDEAEEVFDTIRGALGGRRFTRWDALSTVLAAIGSEPFDRSVVELAVDAEGRALEGLKKEIVDGVEHLHDILTAEQRAKLRGTIGEGAAQA